MSKIDKMKLLHINCNYMGTVLHQVMIEHLNEYTENSVFCPIYSGSQIATKPKEYVTVSNCFNSVDRFFFFRKQKKIIKTVEKSYNVNQFDCIHAYTLFTDGNVAYELSKKYAIPYVVAIRATDFEFFKYRINLRVRGREILKGSSKIFFLSGKSKEKFFSLYVPNKLKEELNKKCLIIPNGIDDFWFENIYDQKRKLKKDSVELICVSQIIKRKNIPLIQKAMAISKLSNLHLTVIGKAVDKKLLNEIIADPNTTYLAPMPKEKLIEQYRKADIFVLPSVGETFGLVYAEALSQGLPIIYTQDEGFDGQIANSSVGHSVLAEAQSISNSIARVFEDYEKIQGNCAIGLDIFKWANIVKSYSEIYGGVIDGKS